MFFVQRMCIWPIQFWFLLPFVFIHHLFGRFRLEFLCHIFFCYVIYMAREEDAWTIATYLRWKAGGYWTVEQSYRWLKSGDIKGETESTIVAAQDQAIGTNYFKNKILKEETESKCWLCKKIWKKLLTT